MSEGKGGKGLMIVVLLALGAGGYFVYPGVQWFRLEMETRTAINDDRLSRFPDAAKVLSVRPALEAEGAKLGFAPLTVGLHMEQRRVGPAVMWFLIATVTSEERTFAWEKRIETEWQSEDLEALHAGGCRVTPLR